MQKVYYLAEFDDEKYYYDIAKQKYFTSSKNIDIPFLKKDKWIKIIFAFGVFIGRKIVIPSTWLCMMITGILLCVTFFYYQYALKQIFVNKNYIQLTQTYIQNIIPTKKRIVFGKIVLISAMLVLVYCIYLVVNGALLMSEILTCCAVFYFILDFNHISPLITPKEVKIMLEQLKDRTSKKME